MLMLLVCTCLHCHYGPAWPTSAHGPHGVFRNVLNSELRLCLRFCQASPSSGMPSTGTIPKPQLEHGQTSIPRPVAIRNINHPTSGTHIFSHFSFNLLGCHAATICNGSQGEPLSRPEDSRLPDEKDPF